MYGVVLTLALTSAADVPTWCFWNCPDPVPHGGIGCYPECFGYRGSFNSDNWGQGAYLPFAPLPVAGTYGYGSPWHPAPLAKKEDLTDKPLDKPIPPPLKPKAEPTPDAPKPPEKKPDPTPDVPKPPEKKPE